jgi:glutamine amidotransferase
MARLIGYFANQSDRIRCAIAAEAGALNLGNDVPIDGWGVGSYQSGEVLLRRRPSELRDGVDFADLVHDLRTDCAVVHVRSATVGNRSLENTHPFRVRQWIFAHTGSIPGFEAVRPAIVAQLPDFLLRNVRGETDSEVLFSLFLSFIHETGRLDDPELDRRTLATALEQTVRFVDDASTKAQKPLATLNCVVTNHHAMVALRRGLPMNWVKRQGIRDCAVCRKQPEITGREPKRVDHDAFKYVVVASLPTATPAGWTAMPEAARGSILAIDRALDAQVIEFS